MVGALRPVEDQSMVEQMGFGALCVALSRRHEFEHAVELGARELGVVPPILIVVRRSS